MLINAQIQNQRAPYGTGLKMRYLGLSARFDANMDPKMASKYAAIKNPRRTHILRGFLFWGGADLAGRA